MDLVLQSGRRPVTASALADFLRCGDCPPDLVAITFDDGFLDFFDAAHPIMADRGIASSLYVTTGWLEDADPVSRGRGPDDRMLSSPHLLELGRSGVEIGAHSETHPQMDTLGLNHARREFVGSKHRLEDILNGEVRSFAYPHGFQSPRLRVQARSAGYSSAMGVRNAISHPGDDLFNIARLTVTANTSPVRVAQWLAATGAPTARDREAVRTLGFRVTRRTLAVVTRRPRTFWG